MPNENIAGNSWQNYKISINELEDITGYDFLNNLPDELEEILEDKNTLIPEAKLLAASGIDSDSIISSNSSVGHNSISEKSSTEIGKVYEGIGQIGVNNISSAQSRSRQVSPSQIGSSKTGISQVGISQVGSFKINSADTSFYQISPPQVNPSKIDIFQSTNINFSLAQIGATKVNSNNIDSLHESTTEIDLFENGNTPFLPISQVRPAKISFASSVSPEQFFKSHFHNSTPEIINALNNSPTSNDSFGGQIIEPEAIYGINSTNAPLTDIPDSRWVSSLNPTYAIGDRTELTRSQCASSG
jgi:hypothetical protein